MLMLDGMSMSEVWTSDESSSSPFHVSIVSIGSLVPPRLAPLASFSSGPTALLTRDLGPRVNEYPLIGEVVKEARPDVDLGISNGRSLDW